LVVVDVPAKSLAVKLDRPIDVLHGQWDELDLEVHEYLLFVGPDVLTPGERALMSAERSTAA
jgi:hypothetical protein